MEKLRNQQQQTSKLEKILNLNLRLSAVPWKYRICQRPTSIAIAFKVSNSTMMIYFPLYSSQFSLPMQRFYFLFFSLDRNEIILKKFSSLVQSQSTMSAAAIFSLQWLNLLISNNREYIEGIFVWTLEKCWNYSIQSFEVIHF